MRRRGIVRLARRKAERRLAVFGCILSGLPVECVPLHERIVFFLFQPIRRPRAFLVAGRHITRSRHAGGLRFGAFESNDFLGHVRYSLASGVASSSSPSRASSSVRPKSEVTDWRTREALLCFSSCDWHSTVKRANGIASSRAREIGLPDISHLP